MDDQRKFHQKPRAIRKILEYHSCDDIENDDSPKKVSKFKFPPPPNVFPIHSPSKSCSPLWQSTSDVETTSDSQSDTGIREASSPMPVQHRNTVYTMRGYQSDGSPVSSLSRCLPPIGVFWDIENCQIPRGRSAITVAQTIRDRFFDGYREVEFLVVCDVKKETAQVVQELNDAQVNLIHVGATSKNAADEKLRQSIRRFADIHGSPSAVILISGDINFAPDLCDLRHRKKVHVILIHNDKCSESLILCANEHYKFSSLVSNLPYRINAKAWSQPSEVFVWNLPAGQDHARIRHRLKRLAENCGGRVGFISDLTTTIRFPSEEAAARAQKRMDGEKVFGSTIVVENPVKVGSFKDGSPLKYNQSRKISMLIDSDIQHSPQYFGISQQSPHPLTPLMSIHNFQKMTLNGNSYPQLQALGCSGEHILSRSKSMVNTRSLMYTSEQKLSWNMLNQNRVLQPKGRPILGVHDTSSALKTTNQHTNIITSTPNKETFVDTLLKRTLAESPTIGVVNRNYQAVSYHNYQNGVTPQRKCRTPSPHLLLGINTSIPPPPIVNLPRRKSKNDEVPMQPVLESSVEKAVELYVTNLDQSLDTLELKKILISTFKDYVTVLHVAVFMRPNGMVTALVKVPSMQAAEATVAHLQNHKVGVNHIKISYAEPQDVQANRSQVVSLLSQEPGFCLPLQKFCEQYKARYESAVNVSSLYCMQDTCTITEETCGLVISLTLQQKSLAPEKDVLKECANATVLEPLALPNVRLQLFDFSKHMQYLVRKYNNNLPLASLVQCYEKEFGCLLVDDSGVPLEHLLTWVSAVELYTDKQGVKHVRPFSGQVQKDGSEDGPKENMNSTVQPSKAQLCTFNRELVELLRLQPRCQLLLSQFIPTYHQHFSQQCCVAEYGFTKLIDLMEAVPSVQVIGEGNKRILVLTRNVQARHFTSDLMRMLRTMSSKQISLAEFDSVYERVYSRTFDPVYYGLCYLDDLLMQLTDGVIAVSGKGPSCVIAIAKREQTMEEVKRMQQFAVEMVELLGLAPEYKIALGKIVPAYHHHFKRQCRMSDYGFTKLVQLFYAIPHVVKLEDGDDKQRNVTLTNEKKLEVLSSQILELVSPYYPSGMPIANITLAFRFKFGYDLVPAIFDCTDLHNLLEKLQSVVMVCSVDGVTTVTPLEQPRLQQLSLRVCRVLMERPNAKMTLVDFQKVFQELFCQSCELEMLEKDLKDTVKVSQDKDGEVTVQLTSLQLFARDVYRLLSMSEGRLALGSFEAMYLRTLGTAVQPAQYGYKDIITLLQAIPHTVMIRGRGNKQILIINKAIQSAGIVLPSSQTKGSPSHEACSTKNSSTGAGSNSVSYSQEVIAPNQAQLNLLHGITGSITNEPQARSPLSDLTSQSKSSVAQLPCTHALPHIVAPDPSELPLPQLFTNKQQQDIGNDAGVCMLAVDLLKKTCSNLDVADTDSYLVNNKRKMRLAAQFQTPIQLI